MPPPRSLRRAARAALLLLVAALVPAGARAQPACAAGPLAGYLASGFACHIGAWAFDEFDAFLFTDASQGVFTFAPGADQVDVVPFSRADAHGHVAVDFLGLGSAASFTASQRGGERGVAAAQIQFLGHALVPAARLVGARAVLTAGVEGTAPGTTFCPRARRATPEGAAS